MNRDRQAILVDLIQGTRPTAELLAELREYGWDSPSALVILTRRHLLSVLRRYLTGKLSSDGCREWAEAVFGRDDIGLEAGWEERLKRVLFEVSEPEINGPMTRARAIAWVELLGAPTGPD